jgi:hypothetical protein
MTGRMTNRRRLFGVFLCSCGGLLNCGDLSGSAASGKEKSGVVSEPQVAGAFQITSPAFDVRTAQTSTITNMGLYGTSYLSVIAFDTDIETRTDSPFDGKISYTTTTATLCPGASRVGFGEYLSGLGWYDNPPYITPSGGYTRVGGRRPIRGATRAARSLPVDGMNRRRATRLVCRTSRPLHRRDRSNVPAAADAPSDSGRGK